MGRGEPEQADAALAGYLFGTLFAIWRRRTGGVRPDDLFPASIPALAPDGWERAADARHRVTAENRRQRKEFSSHPLRLSQIR